MRRQKPLYRLQRTQALARLPRTSVLPTNDVIDLVRKPALSSRTKQYSQRRPARSMTRRREASSTSRATGEDLSGPRLRYPQNVLQVHEVVQFGLLLHG